MPPKRKDPIYSCFREISHGTEFQCKLDACNKLIICCANKGVTNLRRHLALHTELYAEYETNKVEIVKNELQEKERDEREQRAKVVKITEHVPVQSCSKLFTTHPRQRKFIRNLIACAAQPSQSIHFFTRAHKPDSPAPFRTLIEHLDSSMDMPSHRTLTRSMQGSGRLQSQGVCSCSSVVQCTDSKRAEWRGRCDRVRWMVGPVRQAVVLGRRRVVRRQECETNQT